MHRPYLRGHRRGCAKSARCSGRPTRPRAPPGSIRREFGSTIMVNAAHASDSAENARREMNIVRIRENNFKSLIESFYQ
ncbi:MAG: nucleoside-diphosphate kinase [Verrucomicrobiota bacterium]